MHNQMISVSREDPNLTMKKMTINENQALDRSSAKVSPPIEFVTENGFSIVRLSELKPATADSQSECHFVVRQPDSEESDVSVGFADRVVAQVQSQRHIVLPATSDFWLTLAEEHLATYVWNNNHVPAGGHLVVSQLSGHDLVLAARWLD
jgi:hypothetical protein